MVGISSAENMYLGRMRELDSFARNEFDIQIIDQDFAPEHTTQPSKPDSLQGFDNELERLQGQIDSDTPERSDDLMLRNLASARAVIGVLAGETVIGKSMSYEDFVESTMGLRPEKIPKRKLRRQKEEMAEIVGNLGHLYDEDERESFNDKYAFDPGGLEDEVEGLMEVMRSDVTKALGKTSLDSEEIPTIEIETDENPWQGYFGYDKEKGFYIKLNNHPKAKVSRLEEQAVLAHEGGHWASSAIKYHGIKSGELSPVVGILPVFSQAYTQDEIIARTVEAYMFDNWRNDNGTWRSDLAHYLYEKFGYENNVYNNMLIQANSGTSQAEVVVDARMLMPFQEPDKIRKDTKSFSDNLIFKTVFAVDVHALRIGRRIASLPDQQRRATLGRLCVESLAAPDLLKSFS